MNEAAKIVVCGVGAVTPAGWGVGAMRDGLIRAVPLPFKELGRPGWQRPLFTRAVPMPSSRPDFMTHPRLRRASPISHYAVGAALEALGGDASAAAGGWTRLGIILCVMSGCVNYSSRFYDEVLKDPATASPLIFPETVFNAPASHLAALLGTTAINYTLVGDPGTFLQGLALAADWLALDRVDGCLVIGAEELDWLTADAYACFTRKIVLSAGAGALYLGRHPVAGSLVELASITDPQVFFDAETRTEAARRMRSQLPAGGNRHLLCDGLVGLARDDRDERSAWKDWDGPRLSPKRILGEGLAAASAWQCVAAVDALRQGRFAAATVSVVGCNEQAIGAHFLRI